jgi:hypothetical protein
VNYIKLSANTTNNAGRIASTKETFPLPILDLKRQRPAAANPNKTNHKAARRNPETPVNETD